MNHEQLIEKFETMENYHTVGHKDKVELFHNNKLLKEFRTTLEALAFAIDYNEYILNNSAPKVYFTIQKGYGIFGRGSSLKESWNDAKEWIDKDSPLQNLSVEELPNYSSADDGEFCIVELEDYENGDR